MNNAMYIFVHVHACKQYQFTDKTKLFKLNIDCFAVG